MSEELKGSGDSSAEPGTDSPPIPHPSARISRRGLLIAIGGLALGSTPVLAPLVGKAAGVWGGPGVEPGETLSEERLQAIVENGLQGSLPLYLPKRLPAGWKPAPYQPDAASDDLGEAVFINPVLLPGVLYRIGYTAGDGGYGGRLITLTVRKPMDGTTSRPSDNSESVTGDYINVVATNEAGLDILVQGRVTERTAVRELAASVVSV